MSDANVKLAFLHALPSTAVNKGCISLIMKLVTSLASKPSMAPLRLTLLAKLWRLESRCYPFIQKALLEPTPSTSAMEYQITQAAVIRDTKSTHATQYGSDLLPKHSVSRGVVGVIITASTTRREMPRHPPQILTAWLNKSLESGLHTVIHSDKSGTTDLATMFGKIKAALEEPAVPEANQLVLSQALEPLVYSAADTKKMLKEGEEAADNGGEEPIETVGKMKRNAVEEEIENWIVPTSLKYTLELEVRATQVALSRRTGSSHQV